MQAPDFCPQGSAGGPAIEAPAAFCAYRRGLLRIFDGLEVLIQIYLKF